MGKRLALAAVILLFASAAACAQDANLDARAKTTLSDTAASVGWPQNPYQNNDFGGLGIPGNAYEISPVGTRCECDRAFIAVSTEDGAKKFLDTLQENGMKRSSYHGYDAVIMSKGEKVCDAGGVVGVMLKMIRAAASYLAKAFGNDDFDPREICAEATGTVAWRCGGILYMANSPDEDDNSKAVANALFQAAEKRRLCGGEDELRGKITDGHGKAMPYLTVEALFNGKTYPGLTDEDGKYAIRIKDFFPDEKNPQNFTLKVKFKYVRDGKNYFTILDESKNGVLVEFEKILKLAKDEDKNQDVDFNINVNPKWKMVSGNMKSNCALGYLSNRAAIYVHTHEAVEFAIKVYKANVNYKLPVDVHVNKDDDKTFYNRVGTFIYISASDVPYGSSNRPDNREYHEFSHHIQFSQWGGKGLRGPNDRNHWGYKNEGTGDSYTEGFAEFSAMAMSKYFGDKNPSQYADIANLENNYKAWSYEGKAEELAVAGILWDLYDDQDDAGDSISIPLSEMWPILKVRRDNFYEYYKAFKKAYPKKSKEIDNVFIAHGFFADKDVGNKRYDVGEAYFDSDGDKTHDANEKFIDYGTPAALGRPWMIYDKGEVIGRATNYERANRSLAVKLPNAYLKVADTKAKKYRIKVHYNDPGQGRDYEYVTDLREGSLYVAPLPEDVDATITVVPESKAYRAKSTYTISSKEQTQKYYLAKEGYFDSHTFDLEPTGQKDDTPDYNEGVEPKQYTDAGYDTEGPSEGCFCIPALTFLLAGLGAACVRMFV